MKRFPLRRPLIFSLLLALLLLGLMFISNIPFPETVVGDVGEISPEQIQQPSKLDQALSSLRNAETLYLALTVVLAVVLVSAFGWWREVGFNRPISWWKLILLWFPILVIVLTLSGGVRVSGSFFLTATLVGRVTGVYRLRNCSSAALYGASWHPPDSSGR